MNDDDRIIPDQAMPDHYWLQLKDGRVYPWCASSLFLQTPGGSARYFANTPGGIARAVEACWSDHNAYGGWRQANLQRARGE
jgi:hypothetical protein